ncbi:hypothetical protein D3C78_1939650 [compost metagenome]
MQVLLLVLAVLRLAFAAKHSIGVAQVEYRTRRHADHQAVVYFIGHGAFLYRADNAVQ